MTGDEPPGATPLGPDDLAGLLPSSIATQADLNAFEQANINEAQRWALRRTRPDHLGEIFIRQLHRRMFDLVWRWAGRYRTSDKNIGGPWQDIPTAIHRLCGDTQHWIDQRTYEWDELGARFHHRLVSIHPFANGNGRHARLMTDVLLFNQGWALFTWGRKDLGPPSETRARYIDALKRADLRDYRPLVAFVRS